MPKMILQVVDDPGLVDDVVRVWIDAGVSGLTIMDSSGWTRRLGKRGLRDDIPLFPSSRKLLMGRERNNRTIFSVVNDDFDIDDLIRRTEEILGPLDAPDSGILLVLPVTRAIGLIAGKKA
jgi:hypothetical protein